MPRQLFNHFPWENCGHKTPECERVEAKRAGNTCASATMWQDEQGFGIEIKGVINGLVYGVEEEQTISAAEEHIREELNDIAIMMRAAKVEL